MALHRAGADQQGAGDPGRGIRRALGRPRASIADALDAAGGADDPSLDVLLQVNLTDDPGRGGVAPADLERLAEHVGGMPHPAPARRHGRRPARRGSPRRRSRGCATYADRVRGDRARRDLDLGRDDGGFPRSDRRRRDTPADRLGNHGPEARARLTSKQTSTHGGCDVEPAQEDHGVPGPRRRGRSLRRASPAAGQPQVRPPSRRPLR